MIGETHLARPLEPPGSSKPSRPSSRCHRRKSYETRAEP